MPRDVEPSAGDPIDEEIRALESARAALYRPGADDAARRSYAELAARLDARRSAEPAAVEGADAVGGRRGPRRTVIAASAVTVTAVGVIFLAALVLPRSVAVEMTPMRMVGASDTTAQEAAVLSLFAGSFAAQNKLALRAVVDPPPAFVDGRVQRSSVRQTDGTGILSVPQRTRSGTATVIVLCTTASAYRWVLTATEAGRSRVLATSSSTGCLGTASYATVNIREERGAVLRVRGRRGGKALVALVVVPDSP